MTGRLFLTPASLPATTANRCLEIPNSAEWFGLFNQALLLLCQTYNYEQVNDTDLDPETVAAQCLAIYTQYLQGACDMPFYVRQNEEEPCTLEWSNDDETWTPFADLKLCVPNLRIDPNTGQLETSPDGETWAPVDGSTNEQSTVPTHGPLPVRDDADALCAAATNAAIVLEALYYQTWHAFAVESVTTVLQLLVVMSEFVQALIPLNIPIDEAFAQAIEMWEASDDYSEDAFTTAQHDELVCILRCNAEVIEAGYVAFDYDAVRDAISAAVELTEGQQSGLNGDLFFVGAAGLEAAGSVNATDTWDCSECPCVECQTYVEDFTGGVGDKTTISPTPIDPWGGGNHRTGGEYDATVGRTAAGSGKTTLNASGNNCIVLIDLGLECDIEYASMWIKKTQAVTALNVGFLYFDADKVEVRNSVNGGSITTDWFNHLDSATAGVRYVVAYVNTLSGNNTWVDDIHLEMGS